MAKLTNKQFWAVHSIAISYGNWLASWQNWQKDIYDTDRAEHCKTWAIKLRDDQATLGVELEFSPNEVLEANIKGFVI